MARPTHAAINDYWGLHIDEFGSSDPYAPIGYVCRDKPALADYSHYHSVPRVRTHTVNVDIDDAGDTLTIIHKYGGSGAIVVDTIIGAKDRTSEELTEENGYPFAKQVLSGVPSLDEVKTCDGFFACECSGVTGSEDVVVYSIHGLSEQDIAWDNDYYCDANRSDKKLYDAYSPLSSWLMQRVAADTVNLLQYMETDVVVPMFGGATSYDLGT